jgi:hypothetical protein
LFAQGDVALKYGNLITPSDLKENLSIIASDALEGRKTGTRGQKMAAAFISNHFDELGLGAPVNGSHYQVVELYSSAPGETYVKLGESKYTNFNEVVYFGAADTGGETALDVVFAGKGTEADFANLNVKDKAVLVLQDALSFNALSAVRKINELARGKGAKMLLLVFASTTDQFKQFAGQLKPYLADGSFSLEKPNTENKGAFLIDQSVAEKILNSTYEKLSKVSGDAKAIAKVKPGKFTYKVVMNSKIVKSENILGYLEGTDKKDELIIVSAHFDHIGVEAEGDDKINNGADDDGSGTVSVLQMAKAFAQAKKEGHGPRRSILFMTVTGEEEGLFGSEYYVTHPVFPLAQTVADLNIDMVGRRDPEHKGKADYVYVIGSDKLSSELHAINESNNKKYTQLEYDYTYNDENHPTNLYKRSDHWNFAKNNIPIVFYFDGIHEDYHRVSDEVGKIEFDLLAKRAKNVFFTAWELANRDSRIVVDKK